MTALDGLTVGGTPEAWRAAGFTVVDDRIRIGAVTLALTSRSGRDALSSGTEGRVQKQDLPVLDATLCAQEQRAASRSDEGDAGIVGWSLPAADGLPHADITPARPTDHPNTATAIDHVVIASPDLDRTTEALVSLGLDLRRTRDAGRMEQRFFRAGEVILEVVGTPGAHDDGPSTFWGLALTVEDLDAAAALLGGHLGPVSDAVQRGRRIATLRHEPLGLHTPIALMTAPPPRHPA